MLLLVVVTVMIEMADTYVGGQNGSCGLVDGIGLVWSTRRGEGRRGRQSVNKLEYQVLCFI